VTRMSDNGPAKNKENELDPIAQLEKLLLAEGLRRARRFGRSLPIARMSDLYREAELSSSETNVS
ncbi:hypothetical protein, partial [uncultured Roseovarius sp.]|uniref:hypothetical protein n=1 Tax=uncultured Roseovarius sp. TaxID=293344 RepID=UPI002637378A